MESPPSKLKGKIKYLHCTNFITFTDIVFKPNIYLNVVLGPNGTGKSSLVSAIVLGLGGDTKSLNRATTIADYIKNGQEDATIRVAIFDDDEGNEKIFQRKFNRSGKSEFHVAGQKMPLTRYLAAVAQYKVQVENLCQFLPQDRVQEFARMGTQELLQNTLSSVCSTAMLQSFEKLKQMRQEYLNAGSTKETIAKDLEAKTISFEDLKKTLECFEERNQYTVKLKVCKQKRLWLECDEARTKANQTAEDLKLAQDSVKKYRQILSELQQQSAQYETKNKQLKQKAQEKKAKYDRLSQSITVATEKIVDLKSQIPHETLGFQKKKSELESEIQALNNKKCMLNSNKEEYERSRSELAECTDAMRKEWDAKLEEIRSSLGRFEKTVLNNNTLEANCTAEIMMLKRAIDRSENIEQQKLDMLKKRSSDVYRANSWLNENQHRFVGKVYRPIVLEVNVRDSSHAKYFENIIRMDDLFGIVCEDKSDLSLISNELCVRQNLSLSIAYKDNTDPPPKPHEPIDNIRKYGFTNYLIDLIDGPPVVLNYLCSLYYLQNIPIGDSKVEKQTDNIPAHIGQYYSDDKYFSVFISKYSNLKSSMRSTINSKKLLFCIDKNEINHLKVKLAEKLKAREQIKNSADELVAKIKKLEEDSKPIYTLKRNYKQKLNDLEQIKHNYMRKKQECENMEKSMSSAEKLDLEHNQTMHKMVDEVLMLEKRRILEQAKYSEAYSEMLRAQDMAQLYENELEFIVDLRKPKEDLDKASETLAKIENRSAKDREAYKSKEKQALSLSQVPPTDSTYPHADMYAALPNDLNGMQDQISELTGRLDCMEDIDPRIVEEFNERGAEVEDLKRQMNDNNHTETTCLEEITRIYNEFYPQLSAVVERINVYFAQFMELMGYKGMVSIKRNDDPYDFDEYGIKIMVQYQKNQSMQVLDRLVLSGGERAVAIAIYTLSLQNITYVPFRCVDEINQGMDANNEKRVYDLLVTEATKDNRAQFFFVTPKMHTDVSYNDRVSIHVVFNSQFTSDVNDNN